MALDIRYARNGGVAIAYHVLGEGDVDLVYVPDYMSNLVFDWESPHWRPFYERLAQSFRLILFDKRGTGLSDHGPHFAALETRMEDLRAVLDAVGSSSTVVFGAQEGSGMAAMYAATYPERTRALVLFHPSPDFGPEQDAQAELADLRERWGTREYCDELLRGGCPSLYEHEEDRERFANELRVGASPAVAYALNRAFLETDLSAVLPAVRAPTLILYRHGGRFDEEEKSVEFAGRIPGARAMRVSGTDYFPVFLSPDIADEIERFLAGEPAAEVPESVLTTVLFTDLVALVRRELARFRGEERDTAGDGFFATFDGPARAIRAAQAIVDGVGELGLDLRVGIHVGECELHDGKPSGVAVNIGARTAAEAGAGEILVTSTVRDLVAGSGLTFEDRGDRELKGVPGTWRLYAATEAVGDVVAASRPAASE